MVRSARFPSRIQQPGSVHNCRNGFSLLELFLVIAILSALTIISWPMLRRPLNKSLVQDAAQQLQRDLGASRLSAVEFGQSWIFQYRPGTPTYYVGTTIQSEFRESPSVDSDSPETKQPTDTRDMSAKARPNHEQFESAPAIDGIFELPSGTYFAKPSNDTANRHDSAASKNEREDAKLFLNAEPAPEVELAPWSAPIRFYPSGRSQPAQVVLCSEQGYFADVNVQGMAGRITISPIRR